MKKFLVIMLSLVMTLTVFTACGQKEEATEEESIKVGVLAQLNATEEDRNEKSNTDQVFYDDLNSLLLALESGKVDRISSLADCVVKYIARTNDKFAYKESSFNMSTEYRMGTLKENTETFNLLNDAINTLKDNGTLDQLASEYIDKLVESGEKPQAVEMPKFEGAKTIKVAITGDLPPIDYIAEDGTPAGFNAALLAEIAKLANVNIELVQINSASRLMALTEGSVDAVFCFKQEVTDNEELDGIYYADIPDAVSTTTEYFTDKNARLVLK